MRSARSVRTTKQRCRKSEPQIEHIVLGSSSGLITNVVLTLSRKLLKIAHHELTLMNSRKVYTLSPERTSSASSGRMQIAFMRRRLHPPKFWKISEATRTSNFNILRRIALNSLYSWTGNDITIYFRFAANRINM